MKINIDGIYIKDSGKAGIGDIVRDNNSDLIMAFSVSITCDSNNLVEAMIAEFRGRWCN